MEQEESMIGNIRIGICEWSLPMYGPYGCRLAGELGLDGVQLEISDHRRGYPISKPVVQKGYFEVRDRYGIVYPDLAFREPDSISMLKPKGSKERAIIIEVLCWCESSNLRSIINTIVHISNSHSILFELLMLCTALFSFIIISHPVFLNY